MLLSIDLHEDFIDGEGIPAATGPSLQSAGINGSELNTPKTDRFPSDNNAPLSEQIFDTS